MTSVVVRQVRDLDPGDRAALEHVVGRSLQDEHSITITVASDASATPPLPGYFNVYEGLSDKEIADLEAIILNRAQFSRAFPALDDDSPNDAQVVASAQNTEKAVQDSQRRKAVFEKFGLPEWMNVFDGVSDEEAKELQSVMIQRDRTGRDIQ